MMSQLLYRGGTKRLRENDTAPHMDDNDTAPHMDDKGTVDDAARNVAWVGDRLYETCKRYAKIVFLGNSVILFCQYMRMRFDDEMASKIFCVPVSDINSLFRDDVDEKQRGEWIQEYGTKVIKNMMGMESLNNVVFVDMTVSGLSIKNTARVFQTVLNDHRPVDFVNIVKLEDAGAGAQNAYGNYVREILRLKVPFVKWTQYDIWEQFEGSKGLDHVPNFDIHRSIRKFPPQEWGKIDEQKLEQFERHDDLSAKIVQRALEISQDAQKEKRRR